MMSDAGDAMNATEFLDKLQREAVLAPKILSRLREQLAGATKEPSAARIAKLLVERGHLTASQAKALLAVEGKDRRVDQTTSATDSSAGSASAETEPADGKADELGIAPEFADELKPKRPAVAKPPLFEIDEEQGTTEDTASAQNQSAAASGTPRGARADEKATRPTDSTFPPAREAPAGPRDELPAPTGVVPEPVEAIDQSVAEQLPENNLLDQEDLSAGPLTSAGTLRGGRTWLRGFARRHGKTFQSKQWDSPLMLVGGGALALLILAGVFFLFYVWRGSGDELFQRAETSYQNQAYRQSIVEYEKFLSRFPRHPKASQARVRTGLARLRSAVEGSTDWAPALVIANEVLPEIKDEEAFAEARPELAGLLPEIYGGFVERAKESDDMNEAQRYVALANQALQLVDNSEYLPTSLREPRQARIEAIQADVQLVLREIDRNRQLRSALEQMGEATRGGHVEEAYRVRRELLQRYPGLSTDDALHEATLEIAEKERKLVRAVEVSIEPSREDHPLAVPRRVVMADRSTVAVAPGLANHVVFVLARGAVYALDAASGRPLWRRYVGYKTTFHPLALSEQAGADAILIDGRRNELLRINARSGRLVWRLPMGEPFANPVVISDRILVATQSGRLMEIDSATGLPRQVVTLPQPLEVPPCIDARRGRLYQIEQHSTLAVLAADTLQCDEVFYIGHEPGDISVPPVAVLGHLFIIENAGLDYSFLHVVAADADGLSLSRKGRPIRLHGQVVTTPAVVGRRVFVFTDLGAIHVLEVTPGGGENSVREIATSLGTAKQPRRVYPLVDQEQLWVGRMRLAKYQLHVARGELSQKWVKDDGDTFVAPLQRRGDVLFHVRQPRGAAGVAVSATRIDPQGGSRDDGRRIWETQLAIPLAGALAYDPDGKRVVAVTSHGAVYDINTEVLQRGMVDQPSERVETSGQILRFRNPIALGQGRYAFDCISPARRVLVYEPRKDAARLRLVELGIRGDDAPASPIRLAGALLVPSNTGPVHLLSVDSAGQAKKVVHPFQPRLSPGRTVHWRRPAALDDAAHRFVIADSSGSLFLVGLKKQPSPHLAVQKQKQFDAEVISPLAAVGQTGYVVLRENDRDVLASFELSDLSQGKRWELQGRVVWGPQRIADMVLVATDMEGLICLQTGQTQRWVAPLEHGPLAGRPLHGDDELILASVGGTIWRIDAVTGQTRDWYSAGGSRTDSFDVGEPLGAGPVAFGRRLLLTGRDGTILVTQTGKKHR